ncbi:unnamed protein product [Rodentolepis nana]|uniref:Uncharacterized protein n=1 Tax=Rodentolepis nana TaxID=102285 RepID=A0A3P7V5J8_RODNA|nr:unnamed protein product [Rodentolepis nana]
MSKTQIVFLHIVVSYIHVPPPHSHPPCVFFAGFSFRFFLHFILM